MKQSKTKRLLPTTLVAALALFGMAHATRDGEISSLTNFLQGVRYRNQTQGDYSLGHLSIMGGAQLYIDGSGYKDTPADNAVRMLLNDNSLTITDFDAPPLSEDDEFKSNTLAGNLAFTTPSVASITGTDPTQYYQGTAWNHFFDGDVSYSFSTTSKGEDDFILEPASGASEKTKIKYSSSYTARLYDVVPNQVYAGQRANFMINPMATKYALNDDMEPFEDIKVGGTLVDWEGTIDSSYRTPDWRVSKYPVYIGDNKPSKAQNAVVRMRGGYAMNRPTATHCTWDGTECWTVRTHPKIDSVSASTGYTTGGQEITITGQGLQGATLEVLIDGVACTVTASTDETITCITGAAAAESITGVRQPNVKGLRSETYNPSDNSYIDENQLKTRTANHVGTEALTQFEPVQDAIWRAGRAISGYFKAPATGNFRFLLSCDDKCYLEFDETPFNAASPVEPTWTQIAVRYWNTQWRHHFMSNEHYGTNIVQSEWLALTEGELYPIQAFHVQHNGGEHISVGVEFEDATDTSANFNTAREVQKLTADMDEQLEQHTITIDNPDGGNFKVIYGYLKADGTQATWQNQNKVSTTASADQMKWHIDGFFSHRDRAQSGIRVERTGYDASGVETDVAADVTRYVYTVTLLKRVSANSFTMAAAGSTDGTSSTISIQQTQQSGVPLSGKFKIACKVNDGDAVPFETAEMGFNHWCPGISNSLENYIPHAFGRAYVRDLWEYDYRENGIAFAIVWDGFQGNVPQCEIISSSTDPLTGDDSLSLSSTTIREGGSNIVYDVIPLELLVADSTSPAVTVTVDGLDAICAGMNCDYTYTAGVGEWTTQSLSGNVITLTGTDLPTAEFDIVFAETSCDLSTATSDGSTVSCTLKDTPAGGSWIAELRSNLGNIPNANGNRRMLQSITAINTFGAVNSVTPNSDINENGGDVLDIQGTNFSPNAANNVVTLNDGTGCNIESASSDRIQCRLNGLDQSVIDYTAGAYTINLETNGNAADTSGVSLSLFDTRLIATGVTPASLSPILKQSITITLANGYPETLSDPSDFKASLVCTDTDCDYKETIMWIQSVNDATKELTVKFPGAPSGNYNIKLVSRARGIVDTTALNVVTEARVDTISTLTGSKFGGGLVTITGINFSDDKYDNPIMIGNYNCLVQTTSANEITCRVETIEDNPMNVNDGLYVFLSTSEEVPFADDPVANDGTKISNSWSWVTPAETVNSATVSFDDVNNVNIVTVDGMGFGTDPALFELWIDGVKQQTDSVTDTAAVFTITHMDATSSDNVQFYTTNGIANNNGFISSLTDTVSLVSVSPNDGSAGGTMLTVTGTGFGPNTETIALMHYPAGSAVGVNICATTEITGYGTFTCMTKQGEVLSADELRIDADGSEGVCVNTLTPDNCKFSQEIANSASITDVQLVDERTLVFTGTNFNTLNGWTPQIRSVYGVESSSGTIDSDTQVTITYEAPASATPTEISLSFFDSVNNKIVTAYSVAPLSIHQVMTITSSTAVTCSFQGGCVYEVEANGLTAALAIVDTENKITVCGKECAFQAQSSTEQKAACTVPAVSTTFSATQYTLAQPGNLESVITWSSSASDQTGKAHDGILTSDFSSTASSCFIQMDFTEGYSGVLEFAKFYITTLTDNTPFDGNLVFQGSNDGSSWDDLWTIDANIHEGWNQFDWELGSKPIYGSYRFSGSSSGSCRVAEVELFGLEVINSDATSHTCDVNVIIDGVGTSTSSVVYDEAFTPTLTSVNPRFGSVLGGETITLTGTGFGTDSANTGVVIDTVNCAVQTQTDTEITCITGSRPDSIKEEYLGITIQGKGYVATGGLQFKYVKRWSDSETWGNDSPPLEGEAVHIPAGMNLLVDVDSTPLLSFVTVEGSIIFAPDADPNHERTFDAHYVMVRGGYFEAGTEDFPYTSKLTITMHSTVDDPYLPIYGNKVIGVRFGQIELHGVPRPITWTDLKETVEAGGTQITLNDQNGVPLDWVAGEKIVIASTDYEGRHAEQRTIVSISNIDTNPVIELDAPLEYKHFAGVEEYGTEGDFIEMRAEVGLLTRNLKFQGNPEDAARDQYGAHIMIHSPGDESCIGRIENAEFFNVGQAFKLGRYPIHFHMIGTVHKSYVRNNAIWQTYNRAVTIHGVHYLQIQNNVAYKNMGHAIFIEDAAETKNLIENNLIVDTRRSWSLLNTDQTPASIWITHPDNIIRGNHAAGSDRYSYWYDTQKHAMGPSADTNICPENSKIGEFRDNVAHSNGRYGLRIFHNLIPREFPCKPQVFDPTDPLNPYPENPHILARFENLVSYKNKRNGAIAERVGAVQFINFKTADNILAGMEYSLTEDIAPGFAKIIGGLVIGRSSNTEEALDNATPHGIITPRTENFSIEGTKFYNFDFGNSWSNAAPLGTCSHCFHPAATDSGARTVKTSGLFFDEATVPVRIRYQFPYRCIFADQDGTLTDQGPNTWATAYWKHHEQPECTFDADSLTKYGGVTCDSSIQVRRIAFHDPSPAQVLNMEMKILPFEAVDVAAKKADGSYETWVDNASNYGVIPYKEKLNPMNSWAIPFVTNHRYRIHWAEGLDFERMRVELSDVWETTDYNVLVNMNFTDVREAVNFTVATGQIEDKTYINKPPTDYALGDNWVQNATEIREFDFVINYADEDRGRDMTILGLRCVLGFCPTDDVEEVELETGSRLWSDPTNWPNGELPVEGDDVQVESGWNMYYDLEDSPVFASLTINGRLTFLNDDTDRTLRSRRIYVRVGELFIGNAEEPFRANAKIVLVGNQDDETFALSPSLEVYNKVLASVGTIGMFGTPRTGSTQTRLQAEVFKGQNTATVGTGLDWVAGDQVYFGPTATSHQEVDYMTVAAYDSLTGILELVEDFDYYHWGSSDKSAEWDGVDMRGEVALLTRNVVIEGEDTDGWGGQILASDTLESDGSFRISETVLEWVEVRNCSHRNTERAAIRFEDARGGYGRMTGVSVHGGLGWGVSIIDSNNVEASDIVVAGTVQVGWRLDRVRNVTVDNVFVSDTRSRNLSLLDNVADKEGCFIFCAYDKQKTGEACYDTSVTNSRVSGCPFVGFAAPGYSCDDTTSDIFRDNVAHSCDGVGVHIYPNPADSKSINCYQGSHFAAYKNQQQGTATHYNSAEVRIHDVVMIDNLWGISLQLGIEREQYKIKLFDSQIHGEPQAREGPNDCANTGSRSCICDKKSGFTLFGANQNIKEILITGTSALPHYKIKSAGSWGAEVYVDRVSFKNWQSSKTRCGKEQHIFHNSPYASDYIPLHRFSNAKFVDVTNDAVAYFDEPPAAWAKVDDCGEWPCTAPENIVLTFDSTTFSGIRPNDIAADGTITYNLNNADPYYNNCVKKSEWNAWSCSNRNIGVLLFESLDGDTWDRSVQPIYITDDNGEYSNKLNSMMDHVWDGFYTGQTRLSRFPAQIGTGREYTLRMTGTPPGNMRYLLHADGGGIKLKIPYPNAGSYQVYVNGVAKAMTPFDSVAGRPAELGSNAVCGDNRFVGVENFLEFYIDSNDCEITVRPRDAIATKVRMEWTLSQFYSDGGTTRFVDRMAAALGIDRSRIKVMSVYEGSVIVDFFVEALFSSEDDDGKVVNELEELMENLVKVVATVDLGAPILGVEGDDILLVGDPIPSAGAKSGGFNTAARKDDNIWDRYVRIQEIMLKQREANKAKSNPDLEKSREQIEADKAAGLTVTEQTVRRSNSTFKFTILVAAIVVLVALVITGICLMRCMTRSREEIHAVIKAQAAAQEEREQGPAQVQYVPGEADGKNLFMRGPSFTGARANKGKGGDDVVARGTRNNAQKSSDNSSAIEDSRHVLQGTSPIQMEGEPGQKF